MSNFERFRRLNGATRQEVQKKLNRSFVIQGYPSTEITDLKNTLIQAAVVNKEDKEEAFVYTLIEDALPLGSIWHVKGLHLLIDKEYTIIKDVDWHKYHAILCNLELNGIWAYFIGPEKKHISDSLKEQVLLLSNQAPILVGPQDFLQFGDRIMIKGRGWRVIEYDSISTPGITYYSLSPATLSDHVMEANEGQEVYVEKVENNVLYINEIPEELTDTVKKVSAGVPITVPTYQGYFKSSNKNIKVTKHTGKEITFIVPFGSSDFTIQTKNENGDISEVTYKVGD